MASAVFLLPLLFAAYFSQDAIKNESELSTNTSPTSNVSEDGAGENDILSMIERQSALCPYIRLCTYTNRSTETFIENKTGEFPCCSECSCQPSCIAEGTCCPDFYYENITGSRTAARLEHSENLSKKRNCVKAYHGKLHRNVNGYRMIASCKTNFTDNSIKHLCETTYHKKNLYHANSLVDLLPVNDKEHGESYKNIFCYLCHRDESQSHKDSFQSVSFWDSYLYCSGLLHRSSFIELDPLHFGKTLLQHSCSTEFKSSLDSESDLEACKVAEVIDSCLVEHADTKLESLCRLYSWPITSTSTGYHSTHESFKNLACLLCNERIVSKTCFGVIPDRPMYTLLLTKPDPHIMINVKNGTENALSGNQNFLNRTINRYFSDSKGNLLCKKGFIFDDEKNECRQVFCPDFFFLNNGSCSPIVNQTTGLYYFHPFEVIFPTSTYGVDSEKLENLLFSATNQRLLQHFGNESYDLSLWCNIKSPGKMNITRKYVISIIIGNEFQGLNFTDVLRFMHLVTSHTFLADVEEKPKQFYEGVQFQFTSRYIYLFPNVVDIWRGTLYLRKSKRKTVKDFGNKMIDISISQLCYRVLLDFSEINGNALPNAIRVEKSDTLLLVPNFQTHKKDNVVTYMVCLEDAFNGITEANKYIFYSTEQTDKNGIILDDKYGKTSGDKSYILTESSAVTIERSIGITVATAVFVLVVGGIRIFLKRLRRTDH